jgi:branched-chain amino acid transport system substrate-binding protein
MNTRPTLRACAAALLAAAAGLATAQDLVIGTSLPFAGPFAQYGETVRDGYQLAVAHINARGGVQVGGAKRPLKLVILDNQGDPNQVAAQGRKLVQSEKAVALLGALTPMFNVPLSVVADSSRVPLLMSLVPIDAWQNARKGGWNYAWNLYAHEPEATTMSWKAADQIATNKKVALFLNSDDDGEIWGRNWAAQAKGAGYEIVYTAKVPLGTTNWSTHVNGAKAAGAEIVLGQMIPPDAIALWKQMKALGFKPKMATCEKCGSGQFWIDALGPVADGTMTADVWVRGMGGPGATEVTQALGDKWKGKQLSGAVLAYTAVQVLADALQRAGNTDPKALNEAIGRTDGNFAAGPVKFTLGRAAPLPSVMLQWQAGQPVRVVPRDVPVTPTGL